jgi:hypothetical protein
MNYDTIIEVDSPYGPIKVLCLGSEYHMTVNGEEKHLGTHDDMIRALGHYMHSATHSIKKSQNEITTIGQFAMKN